MAGEVLTKTSDYEVIDLGCCGFVCALPARWVTTKRRDHSSFWCPNCGRLRVYGQKSDLERARDARDNALRKADRMAGERDKAKHQTRAVKGHLTRAKKRAAAGTCQCCRRTFSNLSKHMLKQHPAFVKEHQSG